MRNKILFLLAFLGAVFALFTAYNLGREKKSLPPVFTPATNPYAKGIYSNGIIESYQPSGANVNIFPEVAGTVIQVLVNEGDKVARARLCFRHRRFRPKGHRGAAQGPGQCRPVPIAAA